MFLQKLKWCRNCEKIVFVRKMHLSCDYTVNGGNERCNAYFFDSVGFCRKFFVQFLQVVGFLGGPEIPLNPVLAMFGRWNW